MPPGGNELRLELVDEDAERDELELLPELSAGGAQNAEGEAQAHVPTAPTRNRSTSAAAGVRGPSPRAFGRTSPRTRPPIQRFPPCMSEGDAADDDKRCIWVGGIPENILTGRHASDESEQRWAAAASDSSLGRCFGRFGNVIAVTLRRKPGLCKSWALVTFETNEAAEAAVASDTVVDGVTLKVKREDAETQLKKPTTGALAGVYQHQQEIEEKWMRDMLQSMLLVGDAGEEAVVRTPRFPSVAEPQTPDTPGSPKPVYATTLGAAALALKFVVKAKRRVKSTSSKREQQGHNKREHISWETQYAIARDQLKEAAKSTDLHSISTALAAARYLAQRFVECQPLEAQADYVEAQLRQRNPKMGKKLDLHRSEVVRRHVRRLWDVLLLECAKPSEDGRTAVNMDGYCKLHICIGKAVAEGAGWDISSARDFAEEDWSEDVDRFSNDAGINAWLAKVKATVQDKVAGSITVFGWKAVFAELDQDGDGKLECSEFTAGLRSAGLDGRTCTDAEVAVMFKKADADGGGEIDGDEFAAWLSSIEEVSERLGQKGFSVDKGTKAAVRVVEKLKEKTAERVEQLGWAKLFQTIDTDGSGELDAEEFNAALRKHGLSTKEVSDTELNEIFNLIDADGGGSLSSAEFVAALRKSEATGYTMTFQAFEASMFELADYWSKGVKEETYVHFFQTLFRAITEPMPGVTGSPLAVVNNDGKANYRLLDTKFIGSLVNANGKFDGGLLSERTAARDQNGLNATGSADGNADANERGGADGSANKYGNRKASARANAGTQGPHLSSDNDATMKKLKRQPTPPTAARPGSTSINDNGIHTPRTPVHAHRAQRSPQDADTDDSNDRSIWKAGIYKGDFVVGGQSHGPSAEETREVFEYRPQTVPQDEWTFRPAQRYVSVAVTARGDPRRRTSRAPMTMRPATSSGYGLPTSSDYGMLRSSNNNRRTKPKVPQRRLRPWPPPREVTFVEGPMVASRGLVKGSGGRAVPWKGFWLAPAMRAY